MHLILSTASVHMEHHALKISICCLLFMREPLDMYLRVHLHRVNQEWGNPHMSLSCIRCHEPGGRCMHGLQRAHLVLDLVDFGQGTLPDIGTLCLRFGPQLQEFLNLL